MYIKNLRFSIHLGSLAKVYYSYPERYVKSISKLYNEMKGLILNLLLKFIFSGIRCQSKHLQYSELFCLNSFCIAVYYQNCRI